MHDDALWLSEQVDDDEIRALFTGDPEALKTAIRHLLGRASEDPATEQELIDTLELAVDEGNDDAQASVWIAVILGEAGSVRAVPLLTRCLAQEEDETLQDAAGVALLRLGTPGLSRVMEYVEEDHGVLFRRAAYRLLGEVGNLPDEALHQRVRDFFEERFAVELGAEPAESALEELIRASSRAGVRALLEPFRERLEQHHHGVHSVLEDAIGALEENPDGVPFAPTIPPWEERYGWLFEHAADASRSRQPAPSSIEGEARGPAGAIPGLPFHVAGAEEEDDIVRGLEAEEDGGDEGSGPRDGDDERG